MAAATHSNTDQWAVSESRQWSVRQASESRQADRRQRNVNQAQGSQATVMHRSDSYQRHKSTQWGPTRGSAGVVRTAPPQGVPPPALAHAQHGATIASLSHPLSRVFAMSFVFGNIGFSQPVWFPCFSSSSWEASSEEHVFGREEAGWLPFVFHVERCAFRGLSCLRRFRLVRGWQ